MYDRTGHKAVFLVARWKADATQEIRKHRVGRLRVTTVALQGVKDADTNTASASSMEILPGNDFAWIAVDGVDQTVGQAGAVVRLAGKGNVKSLRQDGREVLPSRAADLISADPARRGVYGGAALFVLFAWGVLFKRAVDILAKILLPE